ncbi:conserved protein of unknown function [Pseudomonas marincola]|uniref:Uncharacterized protein n=1 Tax=Pseudomonas marincola TaxID=437900 RepID=A0A653EA28_9PSED|nr:conserved protein of unknown function [Pseudomonas marincola]
MMTGQRLPRDGLFLWICVGGWNPLAASDMVIPAGSLEGICACEIARRIALLRAAIHPPHV